jgi:hypothetical protein
MKFDGVNHVGGRPKGSRNKLFARVFEDILTLWHEPIEGRNITKGVAAMEVMRKEKPSEFVKAVFSIMPKEVLLADPTTADLNVEQVDKLIMAMRKQVLEDVAELN